ncbi:MAG TPA: phenylalanine--tRNA ligase subunit alpha [Gemmatimonadaceae bacterium]|nr:phenylalanine--tRNA ligase subunit alpha [Gemmatimonadaceae bacterium]
MTLLELQQACAALRDEAPARIAAAGSLDAWHELRNALLGRKSGRLTELMALLPHLPGEERREAGAAVNALKQVLEEAFEKRKGELEAAASRGPALDLTMPPRAMWRGAVHPVSLVIDEICDIFRELGFTVALGPEAESPWYNFTALNFPDNHPAMDMHDTLYLKDGGVLRTHTSPVQVRTLQSYAPPVRILAPGNVYRRDFFDATHAPAFAQLEGLAIDEGITFADLKATLAHFARAFYGQRTPTRLVPSYFPFTEPSGQMEVFFDVGDGRGARWIEIMGCGLVHPAVLESAGLDSERFSGWAFGMGPARIAMSRYAISDIRLFYDSDVRFLEQFA